MNLNTSRLARLLLVVSLAHGHVASAQSEYTDDLLDLKQLFSDKEVADLSQPFEGVRTGSGRIPDLFPVRATGVTTAPIVAAGRAFLESLEPGQLIRTQFSVEDSEWRKWLNVDNGIYVRQGVSLGEMTAAQKDAAFELVSVSLSAKGLELSRNIMKTEQTLREINDGSFIYGEEMYFLTVMGVPSNSEPWGWQLDGHHLVINYFVLGDQVVATPMFLGAEPAVSRTGKYAGNEVLQAEQDSGLAFVGALDSRQLKLAVIDPEKSIANMVAGSGSDSLVLDYAGIPAGELSETQRAELVDLIALYVTNIRDDQARIKMADVVKHLDETHFAWIGETDSDAVFYYRIHSPVILIEFDHQRPVGMPGDPATPSRQHIHVIVRTPNGNDYGKDYLRQHLETHPH